jgi:hypothetical protein
VHILHKFVFSSADPRPSSCTLITEQSPSDKLIILYESNDRAMAESDGITGKQMSFITAYLLAFRSLNFIAIREQSVRGGMVVEG